MSLENVLNEIINTAKMEEKRTIQEAEKQARAILEEQKQEAKKQKELAWKKAKNFAEELKKKQLSGHKLELKKNLMQEKGKALEQVVEKAVKKIQKMPLGERRKLLKKLVAKAKKELPGSRFLYANKQDKKLLGTVSGLKFAGELDIIGGIVLANADESIQVDYSFERLLNEAKEKHLDEIAKKLF